MNCIYRAFEGHADLSLNAKKLFIFLLGIEKLLGKLPKLETLPTFSKNKETYDLLIELSEEGYVLGTPQNYSLNLKKFKLENFNVKNEAQPAVLTILLRIKEEHKKRRKVPIRGGERDITQLRTLVRNYTGLEVMSLVPQFFSDKIIQSSKGPTSIDEFFKWSSKILSVKYGKTIALKGKRKSANVRL